MELFKSVLAKEVLGLGFLILILTITTSWASASSLPDFPFIFVRGYAEAEHPPTQGVVSFQIEAFHEIPSTAMATVQSASKELLAFLSAQHIKQEDIETYEITKNTIRDRKEYQIDELKILGYEVTQEFFITLPDLEFYEPLTKQLMQMENVANIRTTFDRTDRKEIESKLILKASTDAKNRAQHMAKGFGKELGDIFAISQHNFSDVSTIFGLHRNGIAYSRFDNNVFRTEKLFFIPSTITFKANIMALFKLKHE